MSTHSKTLIATVGLLFGIYIGYTSLYATEIALISLLISGVQVAILLFEKKKIQEKESFSFSCITVLVTCGIIFGIIRVQLEEEKNSYICESVCTTTVTIVSSPTQKDIYQELVVRVDNTHRYIFVRTSLYPKYQIGDSLELTGKVLLPENSMPHGDKQSFDYISYLRAHNIGSTSVFPKVVLVNETAHTLSAILGRIKNEMVTRINLYVSSPENTLASGMLFGDHGMAKELLQIFRIAGLSHIIVLSGFNIVVIISFIFILVRFLPLGIRVLCALVSVVMFVIMTGGEASVIRATLMAFVALLATLIGRAYVARQALILSLVAIVLYEPYSFLADVSLHLSFLATAGIVYMTEPLQEILIRYRVQKSYTEMIATTLSAYIATLPYVIHTFGTVSVYSLIANILVVPFVPLAMLLSFLVVIVSYKSDTACTWRYNVFGIFKIV